MLFPAFVLVLPVLKVLVEFRVEGAFHLFVVTDTFFTIFVINGSFRVVAEHVVGLGNFLEFLFVEVRVVRVFVRVVFDCHFFEVFVHLIYRGLS